MEYSVELSHIRKEYGPVVANDDISIKVRKATVMCIVGENGAGKSTLMNILYGLEQPTSGEIFINGQKVQFRSSRDAIRMQIGMVHQHFMLVNELSVLENIILGMEPQKGVSLDYKKARADLEKLEKQFGMEVPLDALAGSLPVGVQQKVEILKILYRGADIIILDEPTAVLTPQETGELFKSLRILASDGKTIILITHHLDEVMEIGDDIVVIRRGKSIAAMHASETDAQQLAVHMVGTALPPLCERSDIASDQEVIRCENLTVRGKNGLDALKNVSFSIREGEILGVAGVSGNGQSELAQAIAGLIPAESGKIIYCDQDITGHDRRQRMQEGVNYIPEDRNTDGLCLPWSIEENSIAGFYASDLYCNKMQVLKRKKRIQTAEAIIRDFDVRTSGRKATIKSLSGGNQQKVLIGREMIHNPKLIIAAEPTRGVDVGAISFIHNRILDLRNRSSAVLLISSDLNEIFALSDRIAVLYGGRIVAVVNPQETSKEELGLYMAGVKGAND